MNEAANTHAAITPREVISYGALERFQGITSVTQFYYQMGLLTRLEQGDIPKVYDLWMNPADHAALRSLLVKNAIRKKRGRRLADNVRQGAMMEWLNLGPQENEAVPAGELWWVEDN